MEKNYFIFYHNENASWGVDGPMSEKEVRSRLDEKHYGDLKIESDPEKVDENGIGLVIIKGEIIIPKPVEVVTKYSL